MYSALLILQQNSIAKEILAVLLFSKLDHIFHRTSLKALLYKQQEAAESTAVSRSTVTQRR